MTRYERVGPRGLGGWFLVFLVLLLLGTLSQVRVIFQEVVNTETWEFVNITLSVILTAAGLSALVSLLARNQGGLGAAKFALLGAALVEFWRMFSVDYWTLAQIADELAVVAIAGGLMKTCVPLLMVLYLRRSKRVQNTFPG